MRVQYDALLHTLKAREAELKLVKERITRADVLEERVREQQLHIAQLEKVMDTYIKPKLSAGMKTFKKINSFQTRSSCS